MPYIYIDTEGEPLRELAALYVNDHHEIIDVFHRFANAPYFSSDEYASKYIHGLQPILPGFPYKNEAALIAAFHQWLSIRPYAYMYANDCRKERAILKLDIVDLRLPPWCERILLPSHCVAVLAKRCNYHILDCCCTAHTAYRMKKPKRFPPKVGDVARTLYGHHCALYDTLELYLFHE